MKTNTAAKLTAEQMTAQRETVSRVIAAGGIEGPCFAHIGTLRASRGARSSMPALRFYPTSDLLGQALEYGAIFESVETIRVA